MEYGPKPNKFAELCVSSLLAIRSCVTWYLWFLCMHWEDIKDPPQWYSSEYWRLGHHQRVEGWNIEIRHTYFLNYILFVCLNLKIQFICMCMRLFFFFFKQLFCMQSSLEECLYLSLLTEVAQCSNPHKRERKRERESRLQSKSIFL